jgi:hypothetical protein
VPRIEATGLAISVQNNNHANIQRSLAPFTNMNLFLFDSKFGHRRKHKAAIKPQPSSQSLPPSQHPPPNASTLPLHNTLPPSSGPPPYPNNHPSHQLPISGRTHPQSQPAAPEQLFLHPMAALSTSYLPNTNHGYVTRPQLQHSVSSPVADQVNGHPVQGRPSRPLTNAIITRPVKLASASMTDLSNTLTTTMNQGAALCDLITSKFDAVLTKIDGEDFSGEEKDLGLHLFFH